jgi:putative sigma-54 modulation protein
MKTMRVTFNSKSSQLEQVDRDYAERKLQRLARYFNTARVAHFTHAEQRGQHWVEVLVDLDGILVRAEERNQDIHVATDAVANKLEEQVKRLKGKIRNHKGKAAAPAVAAAMSALAELPDEDLTETPGPIVARRKRFAIKPMSVDEAALQMELLHHDFFAFLNADTDLVSVIYRRRDGNFGLLEMDA